MTFDAVILAGGRATRLGGTPKPGVVVAGATLLDRALAATRAARRTVLVAPDDGAPLPPATLRTREDPPFGGPVAGIEAGLRALDAARADVEPQHVLLLAVDVPRAAGAVPALAAAVAAAPGADGGYLVRDGAAQWLLGLYRRDALRRALDAVRDDAGSVHGAPVRRLVGHLVCVEVDDDAGLSADVDTWDDVARLEKEGRS
jgi:molybdopterin-guanine dinucleotide biosynthesis protein A